MMTELAKRVNREFPAAGICSIKVGKKEEC